MKFAYHYKPHSKYNEKADELFIPYRPKDYASGDEFFKQYKDKTIIITVGDEDIEWNILYLLNQVYGNLKICFDFIPDLKKIEQVKEKIPFYFANVVTDWEMLKACEEFGVSDVVIGGALGFELSAVKKKCKEQDIAVRVCPNKPVPSILSDDLMRFWLTPEMMKQYSNVIDVIEFEKEKEDAYFHIYNETKVWLTDISMLIKDINLTIDGSRLPEEFGARRKNCGRKCLKGSPCKICTNSIELAKVLKENDLILTQKT